MRPADIGPHEPFVPDLASDHFPLRKPFPTAPGADSSDANEIVVRIRPIRQNGFDMHQFSVEIPGCRDFTSTAYDPGNAAWGAYMHIREWVALNNRL